jgi:hypothetical protein
MCNNASYSYNYGAINYYINILVITEYEKKKEKKYNE